MKKITLGLIAHVDSGKTTLSEALLFEAGKIRSFGRVDKGESFFDSGVIERRRGITISARQVAIKWGDTEITLIDTPGHEDFSAEMVRSLQVMDYALLIISASDGITGRSMALWKLLESSRIPVFLFFNKMDRSESDREDILKAATKELSDRIIVFGGSRDELFYDQAAMGSESAMEEFLESGTVSEESISDMIADRNIFPAFFGSALRQEGISKLLDGIDSLALEPEYPEEFGARTFKIFRDPAGRRLTAMKITGGSLKNKTSLPDGGSVSKINQIRVYSGERYELVQEAFAGEICAVEGLSMSYPGQGFGNDKGNEFPSVTPPYVYRAVLPDEKDPVLCCRDFLEIEEEQPELSVYFDEYAQQIYIRSFGGVQTEVLSEIIADRYGFKAGFEYIDIGSYGAGPAGSIADIAAMIRAGEEADMPDENEDPADAPGQEEPAFPGTDDIDSIIAGITRNTAAARRNWKRKRKNSFGISDQAAPVQSAMHGHGISGSAAVFEPETADYLLVDGYNVIFAWDELKELALENMDAARISLLEQLCSWQALTGSEVIAVFDAYKVQGHRTEVSDYLNVHVVFTKEAETADQYIEKFAHDKGRKHKVAVVTSDGIEQIIIRGQGCALVSSREFKNRMEAMRPSGM